MTVISDPSVSDHLSLEEVLARLKASPLVDGVAEFGSRATRQVDRSSDYDLLILGKAIPARVFQMVTTIHSHVADIVLVETETADALLTRTEPLQPMSFEALFAQKMKTATILYDASGRLHKVKQKVSSEVSETQPPRDPPDLYAPWFWQGFGLLHLERMAGSQDPVYRSAFDMMLTSCLSGTWRSYFEIRTMPWQGEKAAVRYWTEHDPEYLERVRTCLEINDRNEKLAAYRNLVDRTLEPIGKAFDKGETAVILANQNDRSDIQAVLRYWQSLFAS